MHLKHRIAEPSFATLISPDLEENQNDPFVSLAAVIAVSVSVAALPALARPIGGAPMPHLHAINPSISLSVRPTSPLQQQIQQDYRSNLLSAQRELLQSNPSGISRQQIAIGHQLNEYNSTPR